jgi:hypothetical protein
MQRFIQLLTLITSLFIFSGCQTSLVKQVQAKNPLAKNAAKAPTKMADVWSSYTQAAPDGKVIRGVAGRIRFYDDSKKKQSVKVDGDLTVFVFDGNELDPAHAKPLKVYQFKADTLKEHYSYKKPLGHGYDFFLPFDEIGGEEKNLCVMTRFDDRIDKMLVMAQPVNTVLRGTKPEPAPTVPSVQEFLASKAILIQANQEAVHSVAPGEIQQANYVSEKPREKKEERNVSTITLNDDMARRLMQAPSKSDGD